MPCFRADLHIHSCLSPCASLDMSPAVIAERSAAAGLDIAAITDHNSGRNLPAFEAVSNDFPELFCLYGLEVNTVEEVHVLCLFEQANPALELGETVMKTLPLRRKGIPGDQVYVDKDEVILGSVAQNLTAACSYTLSEILVMAHKAGGIVIPAHIDKPSFSLIAQLGFVPDEPFDALEISGHTAAAAAGDRRKIEKMPGMRAKGTERFSFITGSDAHYPDDIGRFYFEFDADSLDCTALRTALSERCSNPKMCSKSRMK